LVEIHLNFGLFQGCQFGAPVFCLNQSEVNQFFDSVLNSIFPEELRNAGLLYASLPNFVVKFEDKVAIIGKVKGQTQFFNGNMIHKLDRDGNCTVPASYLQDHYLNCTLVLSGLEVTFDGKMKYGKLPVVNIRSHGVFANSTIFIQVNTAGTSAQLTQLLFSSFGHEDVKFTGLGPLNRFNKVMEDSYRTHTQAEVYLLLTGSPYQQALQAAFSKVAIPT